MKKYIGAYLAGMVAVIIALIAIMPVFASDVTNAKYTTTIEISNNGTAITNGVAVFVLSTSDMITGGLLAATADDVAMLSGVGGSDIAFMPAPPGSGNWTTFVSNIGANSQVFQSLYLKDVTGGKIRYFPATAGMNIPYSASMNPTANATIEVNGYINTSLGTTTSGNTSYTTGMDNQQLFYTGGAPYWRGQAFSTNGTRDAAQGIIGGSVLLNLARTGTPGTVTVSLRAVDANRRPTGLDLLVVTTNGDTLPVAPASENRTLTFTPLATPIYNTELAIVIRSASCTAANYLSMGDDVTGATYPSGEEVYSADSGVTWTKVDGYDAYFNISFVLLSSTIVAKPDAIYVGAYSGNITASFVGSTANISVAVASGAHDVFVGINATNFWLMVDGITPTPGTGNVTTGGASVPVNSNNWTVGSDATPYLGSPIFKEYVGGVLKCDIENWEYAATFNDLSAFNNDGIPTFRTTATDTDLTATATTMTGALTSSSVNTSSTGGWTMITTVPSTPGGLFSEGGNVTGHDFPLGNQIVALAEGAGQPVSVWLFAFAFGAALIALFAVYAVTHNTKVGQRGSLFMACMAAEAVMVYFYIITTIPGWVLIPFGIICALLVAWRKSPAPTE